MFNKLFFYGGVREEMKPGNSSLVINYREKKKTSKKIKKQEEANDTAKDDKNKR